MNRRHVPAILNKLLARTGGWYPLVIQIVAQLLSAVSTLLGVYYSQLNLQLIPAQIRQMGNFLVLPALGAVLVGLVYMYFSSMAARQRLQILVRGQSDQKVADTPELEAKAWIQITQFPWKFGVAAVVISIVTTILPNTVYMYYAAGITIDQAIHLLIGSFLSMAMLIVSSVIMIEFGLINARIRLLPAQPERQKAGLSGSTLQTRLFVLVTASVGMSILMVGPRGYQIAVDILNGKEISLFTIQSQLLSVAFTAVLISMIFTFAMARLIYRPVAHMVDVMSEIEKGDLSQRADIIATDEIALATIQFNTMVERLEALNRHMEEEVQKRTSELQRKTVLLETAAQVARETAGIQNADELLGRIASLISERFGFYHTGIFLLDEAEEYAILQAASSTGGEKMLARGHRLGVGGRGIVGMVAASNRPRIALDVGEDAAFFNNPDLPETRSEMALPLRVRNRNIGVLDIQSTETQAFTQDDLVVLQTLADQIAMAIENSRLLSESQRAVEQLQASTGEVTRSVWMDHLSRQQHAFTYSHFGVQAARKSTTIPELEGAPGQIKIPINLRGQTIGSIALKKSGDESQWGEREKALVDEIAAQVGLAIENARLLQEQQQTAHREHQVNIIANEIRKSTNIEGILQSTARELGKALGATRTFVQIGNIQSTDGGEPNIQPINEAVNGPRRRRSAL